MGDPDLYSLPGFRFSPTGVELIDDYLKLKITGKDNKNTWRIPEIDIYKYEPWDLPSFARIPTKDKVWHFITAQNLKHKNGNSLNRSTEKGFWKSTGKDREIKSGGEVIGMKKSLVYHIGRSPNGKRTEWKMHEYRTTQKEFDGKHPGQKALVLIRLFVDQEKNTKGGPAVSLDTAFCIEESKSKSSLAPVSPVLEVQAETHQTSNQSCYVKISDDMLSDATAPVQCKTDNYNYQNAYVAEKQKAEMTSSEDGFNVDEMVSDATEPVQFKNDNYNYQNAYVAEKQKAEMTSSEDGFNVDEMVSNATEPVQFKNDNYNYQNAYVAEKQKAEMTSSEDGFNVDEMVSDATEPVQFKNDNYNYQNAYVAEKQKAEMTSSEDGFNVDEMVSDATEPVQLKNDNYNYQNAYVAEKQKAEMTSSEDGFNVDEMVFDATEPVQFKNDNYNYQNAYVAEKQKAEMTSSEDDCNVEKCRNMFSSSAAPVQLKSDNFNSEDYINVEEDLNEFFLTPPDDSQSSLTPITPDVSTFIGNKSSYEETQSEPTLAPASQALLEQAENQVAEVKATKVRKDPHPPEPRHYSFSSPSTLTSVTPAVSFPTTVKASPEEAQSMLVPASVSPELGSEVDNYPRCCPAENSDVIISSTIPPIEYNGYNTNFSKEEGAEITSDEADLQVEAILNTFLVTPQPLGCNMLSPLHLHMQADLSSSCISNTLTNDLISGHWGVHHQSGTNGSAPNISKSWNLTPYNPDGSSSSQNNLAFDDETRENMASVKDNGSCRSSDAIAESELEYQKTLSWADGVIESPKDSPGLLKSGSYLGSEGGSSDQSD